ncbi:hypothetical protein [Megamonas funiformis]|uniref:hypothetical protein n=1 Tax=Megamonas funiformis TaxID=437897 RepID=UPI0019595F32|nr:hypothetical protein [Megamonas funiformis]MBM6726334.1 hypothetical protein [Megamonas funiformis]
MNTTINNNYKEQKLSWEANIHEKYNKNEKKGIILFEDIFKFSFIKKSENTLDYVYSINPNKADSILKILFVCKLCKKFLSGKIKIKDTLLIEYRPTTKNKRDKKSLKYLIKYWKKIYQLEKLLQSKFSPAEIIKNFDKESFDFSRLERCLLEKKAYRINDLVLEEVTFNSTNINGVPRQSPFTLISNEEETITFANQKFKLYKIKGLFNVLAKDIQISQKTNEIISVKILVDNNNDEMYLSEQLFINKQDANLPLTDEKFNQFALATPL